MTKVHLALVFAQDLPKRRLHAVAERTLELGDLDDLDGRLLGAPRRRFDLHDGRQGVLGLLLCGREPRRRQQGKDTEVAQGVRHR